MKDPIEVLRTKEQQILRVKKEIDALRIAAQLLGDERQSAVGKTTETQSATDVH